MTGTDIDERSLTGDARGLFYSSDAGASTTQANLGTVGPYTFKASCIDYGSGIVAFNLFAKGSAGTARYIYHRATYGNPSSYDALSFETVTIPANTTTLIGDTGQVQDHSIGLAGTVMLRSGSAIVQVDLNAEAYSAYGQTSHCLLYGTATKAT